MFYKKKCLKDILLIHELAFILLIILAATAGAFGIHLWEKSIQETNRISSLVAEVQQTRGDLYRQMKELFDAYFLEDLTAQAEYNQITLLVEQHFTQLQNITVNAAEKAAIRKLQANYQEFVAATSAFFDKSSPHMSTEIVKHTLNTGLETGLFKRYEELLANTENLLNQQQARLDQQLKSSKRISIILLVIPLILALLLLLFSRVFLKRAIVQPIAGVLKATSEISAGNLSYRAPEEGVEELAAVSRAMNAMADKLSISQETLVRTEKQVAQGLLVPMLAHNIRNPLASIRAIAQVMDAPEHDAETRQSLADIINTVDRLERWTGALLAYLLPLRPQPCSTTIRDIVEGALAPLQQKIKEKSIRLSLPDWPKVDAFAVDTIVTDQHLLEQVLYNLLLNAIDASDQASAIEITLTIGADAFMLQLLDRGCGMPFTPDPSAVSAPTTKRFGTGLGIPFAFKICDALGGDLKFAARAEGGTVITLTLPKPSRVAAGEFKKLNELTSVG